MKIIRSFFLVAAGILTTALLQAQELKPQIAKPVESTVPPAGSKPVLAPDLKPEPLISNAQKPESEFKITESQNVPASSAVKDEGLKPQVIPVKNITAGSPSTIDAGIKDNVDRPILLPAKNTNITPAAPVKTEIKKPVAVPVQQMQD